MSVLCNWGHSCWESLNIFLTFRELSYMCLDKMNYLIDSRQHSNINTKFSALQMFLTFDHAIAYLQACKLVSSPFSSSSPEHFVISTPNSHFYMMISALQLTYNI